MVGRRTDCRCSRGSRSGAVKRVEMAEDFLKKQSIDSLVAAAEHIRDCERCRRVYGAAFDALKEKNPVIHYPQPHPRFVLEECSRELHACERWPIGI